jgi:hypothetical protein
MSPTPIPHDADHVQDEAVELLASEWLMAEEQARDDPGNTILDARAERLSERYAAAVAGATVEELRLAWEAARRRQAEEEMGSRAWADARRVSELLRTEYQAVVPAVEPTST